MGLENGQREPRGYGGVGGVAPSFENVQADLSGEIVPR
jgi:hypothetical protein